jgi:hypothetical protein
MSRAEAVRAGGLARARSQTPAQRRELGRKGYLGRAVREVVDRAPELTEDQKARIRAILTTEAPGGDRDGP